MKNVRFEGIQKTSNSLSQDVDAHKKLKSTQTPSAHQLRLKSLETSMITMPE